jgi:hypothetical protein
MDGLNELLAGLFGVAFTGGVLWIAQKTGKFPGEGGPGPNRDTSPRIFRAFALMYRTAFWLAVVWTFGSLIYFLAALGAPK